MQDNYFQLAAMALYMAGMLGIGWWAYRRTTDLGDYMLAGRDLKPGVAALSAGASDMSGWLLMGLPGALYIGGLFQAWIAIGLTVGAWLNWKFVAPRLRSYTEVSNDSITVPSFLENRLKDNSHVLRIVSGVIILVFFTFYVSSGLVAGGVFFESSFNSSYMMGILVVGGVTILYTLFGGFLGASYTDVAQGLLVFAALILVPAVGVFHTGGIAATIDSINQVNPDMFSLVAGGTVLGGISAAAWGLGYFGQPHIIVRFMAMRSPADAKAGRRIGIGWMLMTVLGTTATAMVGIAYFQQHPELTLTDPEAVFLELANIFFHPFLAGIVLAAVLAAIMSTISSQLLVCSSALVEDLYKIAVKKDAPAKTQIMLGRLGVLIVAVVAVMLASARNDSILGLVAFAWAGFGAAFGPIILLSLYWRKLTTAGALAGMLSGALTVVLWAKSPLAASMYEIVPGFFLNLAVAVVVSLLTFKHHSGIDGEFTESLKQLQREPVPAAA